MTSPRLRLAWALREVAACPGVTTTYIEPGAPSPVVVRSNASVHAAVSKVRFDDDRWQTAIAQDRSDRPDAAMAELSDLVDLDDWPEGTRLIVRRRPPLPLRQPRRQPHMAGRGLLRRRPRPLVPTLVPHRAPRSRPPNRSGCGGSCGTPQPRSSATARRWIIRLLQDWPTTSHILDAYQRITLIT